MKVITIESKAFQELKADLSEIKKSVIQLQKEKILSTKYNTEEACQYLKMSPRTLQKYRNLNKISYSQTGRKILYKKEDLDQFIMDHKISKS